MADQTINVRICQKNDFEENWIKNNPILLKGEVAFTIDKNNIYKVGNGVSTWSELPYNTCVQIVRWE